MNPLLIIFVGIAAGLNRASWGAYKDSPYEEFRRGKYFRSLFLSLLLSFVLMYVLVQFNSLPQNFIILIGIVLGLDTILTESYKMFIRTEDQARYRIPSMFHLLKRPLSRTSRLFAGFIVLVGLIGIVLVTSHINIHTFPTQVIFINGMLVGLLAGCLEAFAGAWKDAPFESFHPFKFLRSPMVGMILGAVVSGYSNNMALLLFALFGLDRMTIEFYKTFLKGMKSGKFKAEKPTNLSWVDKRQAFIAPYIVSWVLTLALALFPIVTQIYASGLR